MLPPEYQNAHAQAPTSKAEALSDAIRSIDDVNLELRSLLEAVTGANEGKQDVDNTTNAVPQNSFLINVLEDGPDRLYRVRERCIDTIQALRSILT